MKKSKMNPKVDLYFNKAGKWKEEIKLLRAIALECGLSEELKWGSPCYTDLKSNIVLIHEFRNYCAYLFFKGALLNDRADILVQQTKNVQAPRQVRFTGIHEISDRKAILKTYIAEAIENERAGLKVKLKKTEDFSIPTELQTKLDENPALKKAFYTLTPGRQRGYLLYFSAAKQSATRESRVEKYSQKILDGKGLNDE